VLAGVDENLSELAALSDGLVDGRHLHEVGARADDMEDLLHGWAS
jgi:hypothetical protein